MEITLNNIKEISLVTDYVFYGYDEDAYTDLLRISKNWISYKRTNFHTKKEVCSWSYKTTSEAYNRKFERLISDVERAFEITDIVSITDCGWFNLRVTFKDNSHVDLHREGNFAMQSLDYLARSIKELIPRHEKYSDFLDDEFSRDNLTKELLQEIDKSYEKIQRRRKDYA